jgi:DNA-binding NtrC family response regulator
MASHEPLLICGEDGTGKALAARALHALACPSGGWVRVAAAVLAPGRFVSLLYGTTADTGLLEQARGGALYIEGIEQLPPASQGCLMELLQQGEYRPEGSPVSRRLETRLICSTNIDLAELVEEGRFRRDLLYRLSMHQVILPPLRDRMEDLPLLLEKFVADSCHAHGHRIANFPRSLLPLLASYPFPGNVPELQQMVKEAVGQSANGRLALGPFRDYLAGQNTVAIKGKSSTPPLLLAPGRLPTLAEARELIVREALLRADGNQSIAARLLGITQPALSIHLKKAGILPPADSSPE